MAWQRDQPVEVIFEQYRLQLKGYLFRILRSLEDSEDLVQETFLKFYSASGSQVIRSPRAYLFTTAYRLAVNMLARRKIVIFENGNDDFLNKVPSLEIDAEEAMVQSERMDKIIEAVNGLSPQCRKVFMLRKIENLSHKEISAKMGISISTVQKHLTKALNTCRRSTSSTDNNPAITTTRQEA